ncbi:MAG: RsmB/NOP family class I SAM-dependent RNA methyltransferase [Eubacterium sp.]
MNLPEKFREKMQHLLGSEEFEKLLDAYEYPTSKGIRANTLKATSDEMKALIPFEPEPVRWCPTGFYIDNNIRPGKNPAYYAGLYYVQEPTAMTSVEALAPKPGDWVLDLCAAPGGKTTQIACKLQGKGLLVANELINSRVDMLARNVERMGITNAVILNEFPERLTAHFYERFDRILVDAPCSGEGMFRKDSGELAAWSPERVTRCAERQMKILETVDKLLKPGGIMVYSTCTFSPEENEQIIENFLGNKRYTLLPIALEGITDDGRPEWTVNHHPDLVKTKRVMPFHVRGEGHFIAKLQKERACPSENEAIKLKGKSRLQKALKKDLKDYEDFATAYFKDLRFENLYIGGDKLYGFPEGLNLSDIEGLKVSRAGIHLGTMKKNRFEPSYTLAMTLKQEHFKTCYTVKDVDEANTYLKGEPITGVALTGWVLVCFDRYPLGFGKASQGMIKNHLPKGLRIRKK